MAWHDVNFTFISVLVMLVLLILAYRRRWRRLTVCGGMMFLACLVVLKVGLQSSMLGKLQRLRRKAEEVNC